MSVSKSRQNGQEANREPPTIRVDVSRTANHSQSMSPRLDRESRESSSENYIKNSSSLKSDLLTSSEKEPEKYVDEELVECSKGEDKEEKLLSQEDVENVMEPSSTREYQLSYKEEASCDGSPPENDKREELASECKFDSATTLQEVSEAKELQIEVFSKGSLDEQGESCSRTSSENVVREDSCTDTPLTEGEVSESSDFAVKREDSTSLDEARPYEPS